jgi:hypothetical protein
LAPGTEYFTDLLKIEMTYAGERNTAANIMYATCSAAHGASLADLNGLAASLATSWSGVKNVIHESLFFQECKVSDWTSAEGLSGTDSPVVAGLWTGTILPSQVCGLVNYDTTMRYRGGHGRLYLPQPGDTAVETDTTWTSTYLSAAVDFVTDWFTDINAAELASEPLTWVLYHRGSTHVPQGVEVIQGATISGIPATQRRRVRRVGHKR